MAESLLIVKLSSLGDVLHTLPAGQALRAAFPRAHLAWAVERSAGGVLRGQPWLDELIEWDRGGAAAFARFIGRLRRRRWDVAIDFQGLLRSGLVTWLAGARRRIGYAPSREHAHWFYNDRRALETMDRHAVERSLDLAAAVGATLEGVPLARPYLDAAAVGGERAAGRQQAGRAGAAAPSSRITGPALFPLYPAEGDVAAVDAWSAEHGFDAGGDRLVILHPHCRKEANRWPGERFTELAGRLLDECGARVALAGGAAAGPLCDQIAAALGGRAWRADGRLSLLASAELFRRARVVVTGDTGPMHIAAAVGTPVVALFGPADPRRTGPYAADAVVLARRLPCSPCFARRRCPLGHRVPPCLDEISVEHVLRVVAGRLDEPEDFAARRSA